MLNRQTRINTIIGLEPSAKQKRRIISPFLQTVVPSDSLPNLYKGYPNVRRAWTWSNVRLVLPNVCLVWPSVRLTPSLILSTVLRADSRDFVSRYVSIMYLTMYLLYLVLFGT